MHASKSIKTIFGSIMRSVYKALANAQGAGLRLLLYLNCFDETDADLIAVDPS